MVDDLPRPDQGRFAYQGLDRLLHERARLSLLTALIAHPQGVLFADLKQLCTLTDGNLSRHLQVLQEAGLVASDKYFERNRPQTLCHITTAGRTRYLDYLTTLQQVVQDAADIAALEPIELSPG
jgi:DNA-binding transcriptional ArsR family regulator